MFVRGIKLFFIVVSFMFFMGISDVRAANDNGYAVCHYEIDDEHIAPKYGIHDIKSLWIVLSVSQADNLKVSCHNGTGSEGMSGICAVTTIDNQASMITSMHPKGTSIYRCPQKIYVYGAFEASAKNFFSNETKNLFTQDGLLNLTISSSMGVKDNLLRTNATLKRHFELLDAEGTDHSLDESENSYTDLYDASDFHKAEPFGGNSKADIDAIIAWGQGGIDGKKYSAENIDCDALLSNYEEEKTIRDFLNNLFWIISIIGIILLIIMTSIEFIKVVTGQDDEGIIKAFKHTVIRAICVVILLLLPVILSAILGLMNDITDNEDYYLKDADGEIVYTTDKDGHEVPVKLIHIGANEEPLCGIAETEDDE